MVIPTLTLIVSNYNDGKYIDQALDSFAQQSDQIDRIFLVDDDSDDDSFAKMQAFARKVPQTVLTLNEQRLGVIANYNRLLEQVSTDLVCFASSNDMILPGLFAQARNILGQYPQAGLSSARVRYMSLEGKAQEIMASPVPLDHAGYLDPEVTRRLLFQQGEWVIGNTTVYRTSALRRAGGFVPQLFGACDSFAATLIAARHGACFNPVVLAQWRRDPTGFANKTLLDLDRAKTALSTAIDLIEHNADIFQPGYRERWRSRWLFSILNAAVNQGPHHLAEAQRTLGTPPLPAFLGRHRHLAKLALFLRHRSFDLPHVIRRRILSRLQRAAPAV